MLLLNRRRYMAAHGQAPTLELSPTSVSLTWEGTSQTVTVTSNTTWDIP